MNRFAEIYADGRAEALPWYNPDPDVDLTRWFEKLLPRASDVIDFGAGPTVHGMFLAARGHRVTAVDAVADARALAKRLCKERGIDLDYHVADALKWEPAASAAWDLLLDRGFLHSLELGERPTWLSRVRRLLRPGGTAIVKTFTSAPRGFGPAGLSSHELLAAIDEGRESGLDLVALEHSSFNLAAARDDLGQHSAWTLVARKR